MEIDIEEKIIGIANVDRLSQVFTLFERLSVQKDTQFKTLNGEIVYRLRLKTRSKPWKPYPVQRHIPV